jgi:anti-anti-sigma regulatory factor
VKGLSTLIEAAQCARSRGCEFEVIGCSALVLRIMDICDARTVLKATALSAAQAGSPG